MLSSRLEIKVDSVMRDWLQQTSLQTGKSQGQIAREAIAQVQNLTVKSDQTAA